MNVVDKARLFSINAHNGQVRKNDKDVPYIVHPLYVGLLLKEYGFSDEVVAAGLLHDTIEDTKTTFKDIKKTFGDDIAYLVNTATEQDKRKSWENRKLEAIDKIYDLPLENKAIVACDKISNLEDIRIKFEKEGKKDFSNFNRGEDKQKWYYESIYYNLIHNQNKNHPMFVKLKEEIDRVFYDKKDEYLEEVIFDDDKDRLAKLIKLNAEKEELIKLRKIMSSDCPYIVEFTGTPRTGKTSSIHVLLDYYKKGGFVTSFIDEYTTSKRYKELYKRELEDLSLKDRNKIIIDNVALELINESHKVSDLLFIDRSINDRQIWNYRLLKRGEIPEDEYTILRDNYSLLSRDLIDTLVVTTADPITSLKRDYGLNLALEKRSFLNEENINEYNDCLKAIHGLLESSVSNLLIVDTSNIPLSEEPIIIASSINNDMRKKYIKTIKSEVGYKDK